MLPDPATGQPPPCPYPLLRLVRCLEWGWTPAEWDACPQDRLAEWLWLWPRWQAAKERVQGDAQADAPNTLYFPDED